MSSPTMPTIWPSRRTDRRAEAGVVDPVVVPQAQVDCPTSEPFTQQNRTISDTPLLRDAPLLDFMGRLAHTHDTRGFDTSVRTCMAPPLRRLPALGALHHAEHGAYQRFMRCPDAATYAGSDRDELAAVIHATGVLPTIRPTTGAVWGLRPILCHLVAHTAG